MCFNQCMDQNKKIIIAVLVMASIIIIGELIWAAVNIGRGGIIGSVSNITSSPAPSAPEEEKVGSVVLSSPKSVLTLGEKITVSVSVDSSNIPTDGVDLVISYDPKILTVETIGSLQKPMVVNNMYSEYPSNAVDLKTGLISVSGITSNKSGVAVKGIFGSMIFKTIAAGKSTLSVKFEPSSTTDSSLVETKTGRDILGKVGNLELEIK